MGVENTIVAKTYIRLTYIRKWERPPISPVRQKKWAAQDRWWVVRSAWYRAVVRCSRAGAKAHHAARFPDP